MVFYSNWLIPILTQLRLPPVTLNCPTVWRWERWAVSPKTITEQGKACKSLEAVVRSVQLENADAEDPSPSGLHTAGTLVPPVLTHCCKRTDPHLCELSCSVWRLALNKVYMHPPPYPHSRLLHGALQQRSTIGNSVSLNPPCPVAQ